MCNQCWLMHKSMVFKAPQIIMFIWVSVLVLCLAVEIWLVQSKLHRHLLQKFGYRGHIKRSISNRVCNQNRRKYDSCNCQPANLSVKTTNLPDCSAFYVFYDRFNCVFCLLFNHDRLFVNRAFKFSSLPVRYKHLYDFGEEIDPEVEDGPPEGNC
jgi:hypothetical protein